MLQPRRTNTPQQSSIFSFTDLPQHKSKAKPKKANAKESSKKHVSSSKQKESGKSGKKQARKKFLQGEVEKMLHKKYSQSHVSVKEFNQSVLDLGGLREDLKEMKKAIVQLSLEEKESIEEERVKPKETDFKILYEEYKMKVSHLQEQLQVQRQTNERLEAHIQSQVFAKQTKDFSECINEELRSLASKHIACQQKERELEEARSTIMFLRGKQKKSQQLICKYKEQGQETKKQLQQANNHSAFLQQEIGELKSEVQELREEKQVISQSYLNKIADLHASLQHAQQQKEVLEREKEDLLKQHSILKQEMSQFQSAQSHKELKHSYKPLGVKGEQGGLSEMQRKCQELYEQIRRQKMKWDSLNIDETHHSKENIAQVKQQAQIAKQQLQTIKARLQESNNAQQILRIKLKELQIRIIEQRKQQQLCKMLRVEAKQKQASYNEQKLSWSRKIREISTLQKQKTQQLRILQTQIQNSKTLMEQKLRECREANTKCAQANFLIAQYKKQVLNYSTTNKSLSETIKSQQEKLQATQKVLDQVNQRQKQLESQRSIEGALLGELQQKIKDHHRNQLEIALHMKELTEDSKLNKQRLLKYEVEIANQRKYITELRQTIKLVKDQSLSIREELKTYQDDYEDSNGHTCNQQCKAQIRQLASLTQGQIKYIKSRIEHLQADKAELAEQIHSLQQANSQLTKRLLQTHFDLGRYMLIEEHEQQLKNMIQKCIDDGQEGEVDLLEAVQQELLQKITFMNQQIQGLKEQLQQQSNKSQQKVSELQSTIRGYKQTIQDEKTKNQQLKRAIQQSNQRMTQKDSQLQQLKQHKQTYEQRKEKVVSEIHNIQNKIGELAQRNSTLQEQKEIMTEKLIQYKELILILKDNQKAFLEKVNALQQHCQILEVDFHKARQSLKEIEESRQREASQCQAKSTLEVETLKQTIKDLANQLTASVEKISSKNQQIETITLNCKELQQLLKENHELLAEERSQREKLSALNTQINLQMQSLKLQLTTKDKQIDCLSSDKKSLKSKLGQCEQKYEVLRGKYECLQQQKHQARKQVQNQSATLRVLREQNKNIEKVMTEQLSQRKAIIEQLVTEKKMLYSHLQRS